MPLYLCRPFSRTEYIAGKMSVLVFLLSLVTWVPGLILFVIQASLAGWEWTKANLWIAGSIFIGLVVWILVLSLLALALSAWIKWKIAAGGLVLGVFFAGAGFGSALNSVMRTQLRHAAEPDRSHVHDLVQALPLAFGYRYLGRSRLDLYWRGLRDLPVAAGAPRASV